MKVARATPTDPATLLDLDKQLCFPLYAASRLLTRIYQPLLERYGLTYPQYIVLMILWEKTPCSVTEIGERALLNSNTLTPLLKRLEQQGVITRTRDSGDERVVMIALTEHGRALKSKCACIPTEMQQSLGFDPDKAIALKQLLDGFLRHLREHASDHLP
jgi:DNA-binding MarR family transcriptional regulator